MESYLKNTLGMKADIKVWNNTESLPEELRDGRAYFIMEICGVKCLVISIMTEDFQLSSYLKQQKALEQYCDYPFVLCFDRINSYQRKCLIENLQAFIVPENQLYMPFLGIALQEHFKAPAIAGKQLTAMAQYILLYFLYDEEDVYHSKLEISQQLEISLMNVTRGVQELEELELLVTKKKGRSSMVTTALPKKELYERAKPYLRNPVQKRLFVKENKILLALPITGQEALCAINDRRGLEHKVRAMEKRVFLDTSDMLQVVDPAWDTQVSYVELEVWRYDPMRFTDGSIVDSISLKLSLEGESDKTVEMNIDKLLDS